MADRPKSDTVSVFRDFLLLALLGATFTFLCMGLPDVLR